MAPRIQQGLPVTHGLGPFKHGKGNGGIPGSYLIGDGCIPLIIGGKLDKQAPASISFVQLAG